MHMVSNVELLHNSTRERKEEINHAIRIIDYKIAILDACLAKLKFIDMKGSANIQ